jgi:hypothetical protein
VNRRALVAGLLGLAVPGAVQGCGVPAEDEPRPIEPSLVIGPPPTQAAAGSGGTVLERLFFVRDGRLVAVDRQVTAAGNVAALLADLAAGPTDAERDDRLTSALTGTDLIAGARLVDGTAEVSLRPQVGGRTDEILAIGQIVCTLDARADVDTVQFLRDEQVLAVPGADGLVTAAPLTSANYQALITDR